MSRVWLGLIILSLALVGSAHAIPVGDTYTVRFDDLTDGVVVDVLKNGVVVGGPIVTGEEFASLTVTIPGLTLEGPPGTVGYNIYEPGTGNILSDTYLVDSSDACAGTFCATFMSDTEGVALTPLDTAFSVVETGDWQTLPGLTLDLDDGSIVTFQFRSDSIESVPFPATILLVGSGLIGLAGVTAWRQRRHT